MNKTSQKAKASVNPVKGRKTAKTGQDPNRGKPNGGKPKGKGRSGERPAQANSETTEVARTVIDDLHSWAKTWVHCVAFGAVPNSFFAGERIKVFNKHSVPNGHPISHVCRDEVVRSIIEWNSNAGGEKRKNMTIVDVYGADRNQKFDPRLTPSEVLRKLNCNDFTGVLAVNWINLRPDVWPGDSARHFDRNVTTTVTEALVDIILIQDVYHITPTEIRDYLHKFPLARCYVMCRDFRPMCGQERYTALVGPPEHQKLREHYEGVWIKEDGLVYFLSEPAAGKYSSHPDLAWLFQRQHEGLDIAYIQRFGPYCLFEVAVAAKIVENKAYDPESTGFELLAMPTGAAAKDVLSFLSGKLQCAATGSLYVHVDTVSNGISYTIKAINGNTLDALLRYVSDALRKQYHLVQLKFPDFFKRLVCGTVCKLAFSNEEFVNNLLAMRCANSHVETTVRELRATMVEPHWLYNVCKQISSFGLLRLTSLIGGTAFTIFSLRKRIWQCFKTVILYLIRYGAGAVNVPDIAAFETVRVFLHKTLLPLLSRLIRLISRSNSVDFAWLQRMCGHVLWRVWQLYLMRRDGSILAGIGRILVADAATIAIGKANAYVGHLMLAPFIEELVQAFFGSNVSGLFWLNEFYLYMIMNTGLTGVNRIRFACVRWFVLQMHFFKQRLGLVSRVAMHVAWNLAPTIFGVAGTILSGRRETIKLFPFTQLIEDRLIDLVIIKKLQPGHAIPASQSELPTDGPMRSHMSLRWSDGVGEVEDLRDFGYETKMYPILMCGHNFRQPANSLHNLAVALVHRVMKPPPVHGDLCIDVWKKMIKRVDRLFPRNFDHSGLSSLQMDLSILLKKMGPKKQRLLNAEESLREGHIARWSKNCNVKWNEILPYKGPDVVIKPRAIIDLDPAYHSYMSPYSYWIAKTLKTFWHPLIDGTLLFNLFQFKTQNGLCYNAYVVFSSGMNADQLGQVATLLATSEWPVFVQQGDDCFISSGNFRDKLGWQYASLDVSMMDQSQGEGPLIHYAEAWMERLGLPDEVFQNWVRQCTSPICAKKKVKAIDSVLCVYADVECQMPTGSAQTTNINTINGISANICVFSDALDTGCDFEQQSLVYGFSIKFNSAQQLSTLEYLRGIFFIDEYDRGNWYPLPSQICKLGKLVRDPLEVYRTKDWATAYQRWAYATYSSVAAVPLSYPILGPFLNKLCELGTPGDWKSPVDDIVHKSQFSAGARPSLSAGDRLQLLEIFSTRYELDVMEIIHLEKVITRVNTLPVFVSSAIIDRIAHVDYGCEIDPSRISTIFMQSLAGTQIMPQNNNQKQLTKKDGKFIPAIPAILGGLGSAVTGAIASVAVDRTLDAIAAATGAKPSKQPKKKKQPGKSKKVLRMANVGASLRNRQRDSITAAPVALATTITQTAPTTTFIKDGVRIRHREMFNPSVAGSATWAVNVAQNINPANAALFPWLSKQAVQWEQHRFHSLRLHYVPIVGTGSSGDVFLIPEYNPVEPKPASAVYAFDKPGAKTGSIWTNLTCVFDASRMYPAGGFKFVRNSYVADSLQNYDAGIVYVGFDGCSGGSVIGRLIIEYDIELRVQVNQNTTADITPESRTIVMFPASGTLTRGTDNAITLGSAYIDYHNVTWDPLGLTSISGSNITMPKGAWRCEVYFDMLCVATAGTYGVSLFINGAGNGTDWNYGSKSGAPGNNVHTGIRGVFYVSSNGSDVFSFRVNPVDSTDSSVYSGYVCFKPC